MEGSTGTVGALLRGRGTSPRICPARTQRDSDRGAQRRCSTGRDGAIRAPQRSERARGRTQAGSCFGRTPGGVHRQAASVCVGRRHVVLPFLPRPAGYHLVAALCLEHSPRSVFRLTTVHPSSFAARSTSPFPDTLWTRITDGHEL